jgi:hypothetical protein
MNTPPITQPNPQSIERAIKLLRVEHTRIHQIIENLDRGSPIHAKKLMAQIIGKLAMAMPLSTPPSPQAVSTSIQTLQRTVDALEIAIHNLERGSHESTKTSIAQIIGWLGQVLIIL